MSTRNKPGEQLQSADIQLLLNTMEALTKQIRTVQSDINTIKADVSSLKELQKDIQEVKQTASDVYDQSEENKDNIMPLKADLAGVTDTVKVLQSNDLL